MWICLFTKHVLFKVEKCSSFPEENLQMCFFFYFYRSKCVYSKKMRNLSSFNGVCLQDQHWVFNLSKLVHLWLILHYPLDWGDNSHKLEPLSNEVFMFIMLSNFDRKLVTVVSTLSFWDNHPDTVRKCIFPVSILEIGWPFLIC